MSKVGTILSPIKPIAIPENSMWLSGQGAGVWFSIKEAKQSNHFNIKRYSPNGKLDCDRLFEIEEKDVIFNINKPFKFVHISHCAKCRIEQGGTIFIFNYINNKL